MTIRTTLLHRSGMNLSFMGGGSFSFCPVDSIHINTSPVAPFNMIKIKVSKYACNVKFKL